MHGSRDVRPQQAIADLAHVVQHQTGAIVGTAALECAPLPLAQQIQQFGQQVKQQGIREVEIVPLFLLPGVHVMGDIPEQVAIAQRLLPALNLHLRPHLGQDPQLQQVVRDRFRGNTSTRILLSHGSRRPGANSPLEQLARQVNALPAYWSVAPSLATQIQTCVDQGNLDIAILPYFLFSGGITDAIAQSLQSLRSQFPQASLDLLPPLDRGKTLAEVVTHLIQQDAKPPYLVM
jgi:sirohydrochlorin ferrochelatase